MQYDEVDFTKGKSTVQMLKTMKSGTADMTHLGTASHALKYEIT